MRGTIYIIPVNTLEVHRTVEMISPPTVELIRELVQGPAEQIPEFNTIQANGAIRTCVALCHEEGKLTVPPLPANLWADALWQVSRNRSHAPKLAPVNRDRLRGQVVVLYGDDAFMGSLFD